VDSVPPSLRNMMLLAVERLSNPDIKEDDPMLNPAVREQLRAEGFSIDGSPGSGRAAALAQREANMKLILEAHKNQSTPLADDFEPGRPELWHEVGEAKRLSGEWYQRAAAA